MGNVHPHPPFGLPPSTFLVNLLSFLGCSLFQFQVEGENPFMEFKDILPSISDLTTVIAAPNLSEIRCLLEKL